MTAKPYPRRRRGIFLPAVNAFVFDNLKIGMPGTRLLTPLSEPSDEPPETIAGALESLAERQPAAPALHVPDRPTLTYGHLGAQNRYIRERLSAWDIVRGDVIAGVIPTRPEMAVAIATLPAAATFAPLSPAFTTEVYAELLARLRPKALIAPADPHHPVRVAGQRCGVAEITLTGDPSAPAGMFTLELAGRQDPLSRAGSAESNWAYLLTTSGTTGLARFVPISHHRLALTAQHLGDWLRLTPNDVGCHLVPMHYTQGLETALMVPLLCGASVACLPESDIDGFFSALDEYRITWLIAVNIVYRAILRRAHGFPEVVARNRLRFIRVGASRLEPDEIDRIERTFNAPLLMGFGMTEARMITADPLPPRLRKRGSVGVPVCNEVAVRTESGAICSAGEVGEVMVRGPLVFDGYFDDPKATAAAFVDGWFRTGDLGYFDDEGYYYLVGRIKDMINRGGEKISPVEIDAAIAAIPGVGAAATFAIPHQSLGEEVAAAVVRDGDVAIEASDIIDQVRQRLGPKRVPRRIYFVDQLPRTETGKIRRSELPRLLRLDQADSAAPSHSPVEAPAPTSPLEAALVGLWCSVLQVSSVGVNEDFFLLGGDSLRGAQLLTSVKAVFGVDLPIALLFRDAATVAGMARAIEAARSR